MLLAKRLRAVSGAVYHQQSVKRSYLTTLSSLTKHKEEFALLESLDMGKPISDAMGYDAPATARCIQWNAEAIDKVYDEVAPVTEGALALVTHEALGVVAAIVPWNFLQLWRLGRLGPH